ncbi:VWA domain-containing protein [Methyloglobulus sp.]|uniref:VWA domain-containing protein n=1 Tax=Methyloglobulus sp. TaxID=2518622 RepID=UPI0032B7627A
MNNQTLNNAFPIVAAALGNKFGVNVRIGGEEAFTDGSMINLPAYNLEDPSYKDVAWGYLAHEAAHVRFTEFVDFGNAATSIIRKDIVNTLEDIRIEKAMQAIYPGTKRTIEKVVGHLVQTGGFEVVGSNGQVHPATVLGQFLLFRLRTDVLGQTALSAYADSTEALLEATFPTGAVTRLMGLLSEVPALTSTRDCVRLADRILRMVKEEQEKEQEKARQSQQQEDDSSDNNESPANKGNGDPQQDCQPQGNDPQSDQDAESNPSGLQADSAQDVESQAQQQPALQGNAGEDYQAQPSGKGQGPSTDSVDQRENLDSGQLAQVLTSVLSASEDDVAQDVFEVVRQLLGNQPSNCYDSELHMPIAVKPKTHPGTGNKLLNEVLNESGKIRASLQGLVQSNRFDRPANKRSGNRIDGRKLLRLAQGDSRIFERRHHRQAPNSAVHLLLDGSGSMMEEYDPNKKELRLIGLATKAAVALALALEGIQGVNPAITRFPFDDTENVEPLLRHGQKVRPNAALFSPIADGDSTPLHSALWYAAASVLATREERKVIMVLTDGQPDDEAAARSIIRRCEATGIELVGIGICCETSHLFKRSIVIGNVSELRSEMFRISKELLLAA